MKTYQELEKLGQNERERMAFVMDVVREHKGSQQYKEAKDAEAYYEKRNITIEKFQKLLRTVTGATVPDIYSANYKLKTAFFRRFVLQQTQYVLSNGVTFEKDETAAKLGADFENKLSTLAKKAIVDGVSFGFWNLDHVEVFPLVDTAREPGFAPLYDDENGLLRAGVRYSAINDKQRFTLYELDGYTEYIKEKDEDIKVLKEKRSYVYTIKKSEAGGVEEEIGSNYPGFPIIPIYANDVHQSELVGIREDIDCYDFIKSGMANVIDETSEIFWMIEGAGGADDEDLQRFLSKIRALHGANLDPDQKATPHTINIPVEAREKLLDRLRKDLYEDFMLLDIEKALSGDITATGIRLAYQSQDDKCGDFEYHIREFVTKLFDLLGIEDVPSFKWNRIANQTEETNMVLSAANYLDDETILKHLPWIATEEVEEIMARRTEAEASRFAPEVTEE